MPQIVGSGQIDELVGRLEAQSAQLVALEERVAVLEDELNNARAMARRTGEVADVMVTLLTREGARRDPGFQRIVESLVHEL